MARPLRIDQEDTFYHVANRGNERRAIFRDDRDREGFIERLGGSYGFDLTRALDPTVAWASSLVVPPILDDRSG